MNKEFWIEKWRTRDIGFHRAEVNPLLQKHFQALGLEEGKRVFLPLCGMTGDIPWLLSQGFRVAGAEIYEPAIQELFEALRTEAKVEERGRSKIYRTEGLDIHCGDIFDLTSEQLGPVDAVYDRAALVALPEEMRLRYAPHLTALTGGAPQLLITYEYDQTQAPGPPFSVSGEEVHRHYGESYRIGELENLEVPGGLRGKLPARERVWKLEKGREGAG